jgi:hypothetical protein
MIESYSSICPDDQGNMFHRKVNKHRPDQTRSHSGRFQNDTWQVYIVNNLLFHLQRGSVQHGSAHAPFSG